MRENARRSHATTLIQPPISEASGEAGAVDAGAVHQVILVGDVQQAQADPVLVAVAESSAGTNGSFVVVQWHSLSGRIYNLYWRASLTNSGGWLPIGGYTNVPGNDDILSYTDAVHGVDVRFYKIGVEWP